MNEQEDSIEVLDKEEEIIHQDGVVYEGENTTKPISAQPCKNPRNARRPRMGADQKRLKILQMTHKGNTPQEIMQVVNMPLDTVKDVQKRFEPFFKDIGQVKDYRLLKQDLLDTAELTLLKSALDERKLKKSALLPTVLAMKEIHRIGRLEKDLSTDNQALAIGKLKVKK